MYCTSFAFIVGLEDLVISVVKSISTDLWTMRQNNLFLPFFGQASQVELLVGWHCCY